VRDPKARYFGGRVEERSPVPLCEGRLGHIGIGLDEWLRRSQQPLRRPQVTGVAASVKA
jgi:hypothetical protein